MLWEAAGRGDSLEACYLPLPPLALNRPGPEEEMRVQKIDV